MKFNFLICGLFCISTTSFANDYREVLSYAYGYHSAETLKQDLQQALQITAFQQGIQDALNGKKNRYTQDEVIGAIRLLDIDKADKQRKLIQENQQKGQTFLTENALKEGVITTKSGLQYKIIKQGTGKKPTTKSTVSIHYEIHTIDGTLFETTLNYDKPVQISLQDVFDGIAEGLQYVRTGGEIELYIPPALAYGNQHYSESHSGSTLIYKVKLLKVK